MQAGIHISISRGDTMDKVTYSEWFPDAVVEEVCFLNGQGCTVNYIIEYIHENYDVFLTDRLVAYILEEAADNTCS